MERPCQLDEAVGHRLLAVQRHKVVVVEVVRDLEAQAVLGEGVAPEVYGPDGLPDLLDQRDGLGGEVTLLLLPGCALTRSHYPLTASSRMCLRLFCGGHRERHRHAAPRINMRHGQTVAGTAFATLIPLQDGP